MASMDVWDADVCDDAFDDSESAFVGESESGCSRRVSGRADEGVNLSRVELWKRRLRSIVRERLRGPPRKFSFWYKVSESNWFSLLGTILTAINCVMVALDADIRVNEAFAAVRGEKASDTSGFKTFSVYGQWVYLVWMLVEIAVHLLGEREDFVLGKNRAWNLIDMGLAITSIVDLIGAAASADVTAFRVLRAMRVAKSVQAVRLARFSVSLSKILAVFLSSLQAIFWTLCLMLIIMFCAGLLIVEGVANFTDGSTLAMGQLAAGGDHAAANVGATMFPTLEGASLLEELHAYYGGVGKVLLTLSLSVLGDYWPRFASPLSQINWGWGVMWMFYIILMVLGVLNTLTGIIVDMMKRPTNAEKLFAALDREREESSLAEFLLKELVSSGHLTKAPEDSDDDIRHDIEITQKTFNRLVRRPAVVDYLQSMGIHAPNLQELFRLVDVQGDGKVTLRSTAHRCVSLCGEAKSEDLFRLFQELSDFKRGLSHLNQAFSELSSWLVMQPWKEGEDEVVVGPFEPGVPA